MIILLLPGTSCYDGTMETATICGTMNPLTFPLKEPMGSFTKSIACNAENLYPRIEETAGKLVELQWYLTGQRMQNQRQAFSFLPNLTGCAGCWRDQAANFLFD